MTGVTSLIKLTPDLEPLLVRPDQIWMPKLVQPDSIWLTKIGLAGPVLASKYLVCQININRTDFFVIDLIATRCCIQGTI